MQPQTNANVLGTEGNKSISMVNLGARDKHVLKMTICKGSDSEDVQQIILFPYLLINALAAFMCKGQYHCVTILTQSCVYVDSCEGHGVSKCSFASVCSFICPNLLLPYTLLHRMSPMLRASLNRGEAEDIVKMLWPFLGSW